MVSFASWNMTLNLKLHPNRDLLHRTASVEYVSQEGTVTVPLLDVAYKGSVQERNSDVGWARLVFSDTSFFDQDLTFEGVISHPKGMFHVRTIKSYTLAKRDIDVDVVSPFSRPDGFWSAKMIVLKEESSRPTCSHAHHHHHDDEESQLVKREQPASVSSFGCTEEGLNIDDARAQYLADLANRNTNQNHLTARSPTGCPSTKKVVMIGVVADCTYIRAYGGTSAALKVILADFNSASQVYESQFNVQLGLSKIVMQQTCTPSDPNLVFNQECSSSYTIANRLSDFARWRSLSPNDGMGLWHLMTKCSTQPAVGIAWLGMLCATAAYSQVVGGVTQYVSGVGVSSIVPIEWKVVTHEIGHNFGAIHDCAADCATVGTGNCCSCASTSGSCDCGGLYIMHRYDNAILDVFSNCTSQLICDTYGGVNGVPGIGHCLQDPSTFVSLAAGICGNGVKEGDEECDCGLPSQCTTSCCEPTTCKLTTGSLCSDSNDDCCTSCQPKTSGTTCYSSTGTCDITQTCDGTNATCPTSIFKADGVACTTSGTTASCISGVCTSRDLQCVGSAPVNTVSACPSFSTSCNMYCQDAVGGCYLLNGNFLDGTTCGTSGKCMAGRCQGADLISVAWEWILQNPQFSIPVIVFGALALFVVLYTFARCCCCNPYRKPIFGRK